MRNILFEGKRKDNGEWVEGCLLKLMDGYCVIPNICELSEFGDIGEFLVLPSTIGQYTGLTDKNGTKIFEGDIVKADDETLAVNFDEYCRYMITNKSNNYLLARNNDDVEVIGNIHDNPELLVRKEDKPC